MGGSVSDQGGEHSERSPQGPADIVRDRRARDAAVRTETREEARQVLLDLAFVPEDAIGPLIIMESRHLDRETVQGHFRAVGGA